MLVVKLKVSFFVQWITVKQLWCFRYCLKKNHLAHYCERQNSLTPQLWYNVNFPKRLVFLFWFYVKNTVMCATQYVPGRDPQMWSVRHAGQKHMWRLGSKYGYLKWIVLSAHFKFIWWFSFSLFATLWSGQNSVLYCFCKNRIWEKESGIPAFAIASTMEAVSDFRIFLWLTDKTPRAPLCSAEFPYNETLKNTQ